MLRKFTMCWTIPGTLSAAAEFICTIPSPCTIVHMSMVQTNAGSARLYMGTSADADEFLQYTNLGVSKTPVVLSAASDFRFSALPRLEAGDIFKIYLDHDGDGGTAAANVTVVITFQEG